MEAENTEKQTEQPVRPDFKSPSWKHYEFNYDTYQSRSHISSNFLKEQQSAKYTLKSFKKYNAKDSIYFKKLKQYQRNNSSLFEDKKQDRVFQTSIPNAITYSFEGLSSRAYNVLLTGDGETLLVTSQHGTAIFKCHDDGSINLSSVISCHGVNWAISDSDITTDNRFMVHSTLGPKVQMFDVKKSKYCQEFNLRATDDHEADHYWFSALRIFSIKLSGDNQDLIAGCGRKSNGAPIQVFDIEANKLKHSISAHHDDINSVCYVDKKNSSVFISGSDDALVKIWDTRILKDNQPMGVFHGHMSGLTSVSSREDNRYFISSSKDQSIKLWDLRKASSEGKKITRFSYDYRYQAPSADMVKKIRNAQKAFDESVMSFWGHTIHMTLIRCHFSPAHTTGSRYVYTGSADGMVYIYDTVSEELASVLQLPGDDYENIIRDCAWHPFTQTFFSSNFNGELHRWEYMNIEDGKPYEWVADNEALVPENEISQEGVEDDYVDEEEANDDNEDDGDEDYNPDSDDEERDENLIPEEEISEESSQ